ncbi:ChuX/HutX family heme-like substrate-binding protein [Billgrantia gudaonensis]|uniref:Putative hemin transport protein n=1 Tax=Billgrantia gudaonensis TaxID=376427 RepID=A0A1G9ATR8_9GAMM|nr:ChuX/HutX family heme-like substrate-binding protein [Halomonas gudaonensis]SDK30020.1 putative hemin transport protein [Halomonas gudaonensis]
MSDATRIPAILDALDAARRASQRLPAFDIAQRLEISEGELQAARIGRDVISLALTPKALARQLHALGHVKALTRSGGAVLEQHGRYPSADAADPGLLHAPDGLDLRLHLQQWHWACAIRDVLPNARGEPITRYSVQVFDRHGRAVHKLFCRESSPNAAWQALMARANGRSPAFTQLAPRGPRALPPAPGLTREWARLRDVHQFSTLLRRHRLERHEANALVEGHFTRRLAVDSVAQALTQASCSDVPLMLFVASPGCVQIRTGRLPTPQRRCGWLALYGNDFTLQLDETAIHAVWAVHKPNRDGGVTSLEAFGADGELLLQIHAERREGCRERNAWRHLLAGLSNQEVAA